MDQQYINSVIESLHKHYGNIELFESTRKDKKFMVQNPSGKWVHFGQKGYQDWHSHKDPIRLQNFRKRNSKWKNAEKWTPAHLSWYVLWT
jgi:hypothetical protein